MGTNLNYAHIDLIMKKLLTIIISFSISIGFAQTTQELQPTLGYVVNKSPEGAIEFLKGQEACEELLEQVSGATAFAKLSQKEKEQYEKCLIDKAGYWEVLGIGCSWYCGGGLDTLSASSELKSNSSIKYVAKNAHDLNYKTAWVEGVEGDGIGESLTYHFPPENPRITKIIIVNGYVKSEKTWRENSRVKQLKMYLNEEAFAILNLADTRAEQSFSFEPIGNADRENLTEQPRWTMRFEIMDVYKGDKYADTAITEIYFDGIDVH